MEPCDPTTLQREADHRVKNTFQLITSIVMLQGRRAGDPAVAGALKSVQQRVTAVSLAHRHVRTERVELAELIRELATDLARAQDREDIAVELDLEAIEAPATLGAPVALWISEALANALTHAFPDGRAGRARVGLSRTPGGFRLEVADDGRGLGDGAKGFGSTILQLMAQQLRGKLETADAQPGVRLAVEVPMEVGRP